MQREFQLGCLFERHIGKPCGLQCLVVMSAHRQPRIGSGRQFYTDEGPGRSQFARSIRQPHIHRVSEPPQADTRRIGMTHLDFPGHAAFHSPILKRCQSIPVHHNIHIRGIGLQRLAKHETGFAVRVASSLRPINSG
ncbi:hypothetical protein SDC9_177203 [bioreactor metagenome]|uniref:Uncharacterized protein n=1 Tax=bioreactor metagenome TaxID=1076179 RepID=A0A645GTV9_9ZZZZ